jgi:hypothetical protein
MADDAIILGSETPDDDVLVYDKDVAYYMGNLVDDEGDNLVDDDGDNLIFEYVD